jgi:hypothetical protein
MKEEQTPRQRFEQLGIEINELHRQIMNSTLPIESDSYKALQSAIAEKLAEREDILKQISL